MAFPSSPTANAIATVNGITYVYSSAKTAWLRASTTGANLTANSLSITSNTPSTSTTSGALLVTGGAGIQGNLYASYIVGNGSLLTGLPAGYSNATASSFLSVSNISIRSLGIGTEASGNVGEIRATNAITSFYSDRRLKTDIVPITNALTKVTQLSGVTYTQNELAETFGYTDYSQQVGVLAQEVQQVQPEAVKPAPFDIASDGSSISGEHYLTVQYEKLIPLLIEAIKELTEQVNILKGKK
jgi:hypothetical protein